MKFGTIILFIIYSSLCAAIAQPGIIGHKKKNGKFSDIGIGYVEIIVEKTDAYPLYLHPEDTIPVDTVWTNRIADTIPDFKIVQVPKQIRVRRANTEANKEIEIPVDTVWREMKIYRVDDTVDVCKEKYSFEKIIITASNQERSTYTPIYEWARTPVYICKNFTGSYELHHSNHSYSLKPLKWERGNSDNEARNSEYFGWSRINPVLRFRILEESESWIKIVVNEESDYHLYLKCKVENKKISSESINTLFYPRLKGKKLNQNFYIVSWLSYLNAVESSRIIWLDQNIYKKPKQDSSTLNSKLPNQFFINNMKGDWIQISDKKTKRVIGWKRWKNGNKPLVSVTERVII